jgi:curli biogenesis system outer membrane secretion channel CsgG
MKRILTAAVPLLAAALLVAGPASATSSKKVSCKQVREELAAGKTPAEVASELKISKKTVDHCNAKVASSKKHSGSSSQTTGSGTH